MNNIFIMNIGFYICAYSKNPYNGNQTTDTHTYLSQYIHTQLKHIEDIKNTYIFLTETLFGGNNLSANLSSYTG